MAEQEYEFTHSASAERDLEWDGLETGDTGQSFPISGARGLAGYVQVKGTFSGGTVVTVQVSQDGANWETLLDLQGASVSFTGAAGKEITTSAKYIRPIVASGSSDSVTVMLSLRG